MIFDQLSQSLRHMGDQLQSALEYGGAVTNTSHGHGNSGSSLYNPLEPCAEDHAHTDRVHADRVNKARHQAHVHESRVLRVVPMHIKGATDI
ncbi:hypothetical protein EMPS_00145 [Entomortierella parvispora]|uniref:Uncharacterized protein n=1 Tax=Entomortierella parvispora TaxID=205924 RepID=A0A9P3GZH7_9FUNG|nr:hypothetical protein EMPS_00145 [Entomortierella parvispora]